MILNDTHPGTGHLHRLISLPGLLLEGTTDVGGLKQQKCAASQFWKPEVEVKVSSGPCSLQSRFLASPWLLMAPGIPWLMAANSNLCLRPYLAVFLCVCLCLFTWHSFLCKDTSHIRLGAYPHLTNYISKDRFQIRSHSEGTRS